MLSFDEVDLEIVRIETDGGVICESTTCRTEVDIPCPRD